MLPYAQTNVQLYNQLCRARWSEDDLRRLHAGYQLALSVMAGHFRPNQKPFLAHLVGVASILAAHGADCDTVIAGLLHSVYDHGEFGDGSRGVTSAKRRQVRRAVGEACESLVELYCSLEWKPAELVAQLSSSDSLSPATRQAVLIRLADVLEDHLDRGMEFSPCKHCDAATLEERATAITSLARALGQPALALDLDLALRPSHDPVPDFLRTTFVGSYVVNPRSHRMRATVRLGRLVRRWRARIASGGAKSQRRAA